MRRSIIFGLVSCFLIQVPLSQAISILSGPSFTPSTNAPLAGLLQLTTDVASRISIQVNDGTNIWERDFFDFATTHSETLLGFKPGRTNQIQVTCYDKYRNASTPQLLTFVTAPLPTNFPTYTVITNQPAAMEPGYTLFIIQRSGSATGDYITLMDTNAQVVWYEPLTPNDLDVRQLGDGNLFIEQASPSNNFVEINMLGNTVNTWKAPTAYPVNDHEGVPTAHGTILYLSNVAKSVTNFPSSTASNAPLVTQSVDDNPVVEISASNSALLNAWSPLAVMDPTRITYLTYEFSTGGYGVDNEHANAIIEDTNDNSLIVSLRDQNAVYKFSRATGKLIWILGPPANWATNWQPYLLTPEGTPFDWNYGQHAPELTPQNTLLLYNDGNYRACPPAAEVPDNTNYSSAEEFSIDETNMQVTEVWNSAWQTNQDRLFTGVVGKAQWLPQTSHVLVTYGSVSHINYKLPDPNQVNSIMARIVEYTHDPVPQIVFDVSFYDVGDTSSTYYGYLCYRATRIPDLYVHPAEPVVDLNILFQGDLPYLEFSADPTRSYVIQASTDLINWTTIGTPAQEEGTGNFDFTDFDENQPTSRFYRIITN
jgi:arylsulfate sulfotransferase